MPDMENLQSATEAQLRSNNVSDVPYIVHEADMARMERILRRITFALIMAIVLLFSSNALWLYQWMQYDYVTETVMVDAGATGFANYIGNDGKIFNEQSNSAKNDAYEKEAENP